MQDQSYEFKTGKLLFKMSVGRNRCGSYKEETLNQGRPFQRNNCKRKRGNSSDVPRPKRLQDSDLVKVTNVEDDVDDSQENDLALNIESLQAQCEARAFVEPSDYVRPKVSCSLACYAIGRVIRFHEASGSNPKKQYKEEIGSCLLRRRIRRSRRRP
ncbi:hypothetical protein Tco_1123238 [Tanacetum coccineum]|uniref:Uncharacterized protein n=1 Tax=Tanacetum coccineum TaxID=301880 RepID=A0ABQ5J5B6_9ASTR